MAIGLSVHNTTGAVLTVSVWYGASPIGGTYIPAGQVAVMDLPLIVGFTYNFYAALPNAFQCVSAAFTCISTDTSYVTVRFNGDNEAGGGTFEHSLQAPQHLVADSFVRVCPFVRPQVSSTPLQTCLAIGAPVAGSSAFQVQVAAIDGQATNQQFRMVFTDSTNTSFRLMASDTGQCLTVLDAQAPVQLTGYDASNDAQVFQGIASSVYSAPAPRLVCVARNMTLSCGGKANVPGTVVLGVPYADTSDATDFFNVQPMPYITGVRRRLIAGGTASQSRFVLNFGQELGPGDYLVSSNAQFHMSITQPETVNGVATPGGNVQIYAGSCPATRGALIWQSGTTVTDGPCYAVGPLQLAKDSSGAIFMSWLQDINWYACLQDTGVLALYEPINRNGTYINLFTSDTAGSPAPNPAWPFVPPASSTGSSGTTYSAGPFSITFSAPTLRFNPFSGW